MAAKKGKTKGIFAGLLIVLALIFGGYSFFWFQTADAAKVFYVEELSKFGNGSNITPPSISGYPGKMILRKDKEVIDSDDGALEILNLETQSWPFPSSPVSIKTGELTLKSSKWLEGLRFDSFDALMRVNQREVIFEDSALKQKDFEAKVTGSVDLSNPDVAIPDLIVTLSNHKDLLDVLVNSGIIEKQAAQFLGFGMSAFVNTETQKVEVPIYAKNGMINLGPLPIMRLPQEASTPKRQKQPEVTPQ